MNLGLVEAHLLPVVRRVVAPHAEAHAGPPVVTAVTGMKFEVWVHAARFEDLGGVTADGAESARRPIRLGRDILGFVEERPALVVVELTCLGPTCAGVQAISARLPSEALLALETMPHPTLSSSPDESVVLRFADFTAALGGASFAHRVAGDAAYFVGLVSIRLEGFLHVSLTRRAGVMRPPVDAPSGAPHFEIHVVQGPVGADPTGEHVVVTNAGPEEVDLEGFVLHDAAARRPHTFVFPAFRLPPSRSVRVWTGEGRDDAENLHWGRTKSVWNDEGDVVTLLDAAGAPAAQTRYPERSGPTR